MKRPYKDDRQQVFDFQERISEFCDTILAIEEHQEEKRLADRTERSRAEFYVEAAAACKRAIRHSGMSRDQIVDRINENWAPLEEEIADPDRKPSLTKAMLDNYLSKPVACRLPAWLIFAVCEVTGSLEPLAVQAENLGASLISADEKDELTLGKLEAQLRAGALLKREYIKRLSVVRGRES